MRAAWRGNDSRLLSQEQYDNNDWDNSEVNKTDGRSLYCWFVKSSGVSLSQRVRPDFSIIAILHSLQYTPLLQTPLLHSKILIRSIRYYQKYFTKTHPSWASIWYVKPAIKYYVSRNVITSITILQYYNITILQYYMLQEMPMNEVKAYSSSGSQWGQSSQSSQLSWPDSVWSM